MNPIQSQAIAAIRGALAAIEQSLQDPPPPPPSPTYALQASATAVDEGAEVLITLRTSGLPEGTAVPYQVTGSVAVEDIAALNPEVFVTDATGTAQLRVTLAADQATEGPELMTVALLNGAAAVSVDVRDASQASAPPPPPPPPPPDPQPATARYRDQTALLFQGSAWRSLPARIPGSADFPCIYGPNAVYVDRMAGWAWDHKGGDWLDRQGLRQGREPWAVALTERGPVDLVRRYTLDITALVRHTQAAGRWLAMLVTAGGYSRTIASRWHDTEAPLLRLTLADGATATLAPTLTAPAVVGTPNPSALVMHAPLFVEFERPAAPVAQALLELTVTAHPNQVRAPLEVWLLDPPRNLGQVRQGIAAQAGLLDAGLPEHPSVLLAHHYRDGQPQDRWIMPGATNVLASTNFDPALWGGEPDTSKLPHSAQGRWVMGSQVRSMGIVTSTYVGDGFEPLAPGVGALRAEMAAEVHADGEVVDYGGSGGANAVIFLPEEHFGRAAHLFTRYCIRLGLPDGPTYRTDPARRFNVYHRPNQVAPAWTDMAGKFGIVPDGQTSAGGTSGSAGGGQGWTLRLAWAECDGAVGGPMEGGVRPGWHLFDFGAFNPKEHRYSGDDGNLAQWGQIGGRGGMLYAGRWYCLETEVRLNTILQTAPGYVADGELRAWLDGVLVFERRGLVFRTWPFNTLQRTPANMPPLRELGARGLWLNWYHGGVTKSGQRRVQYMSEIVCGTEYIGPPNTPEALR